MAEVSALRKHPCPECGGDAEWNPAKQALACPYCGTVLPWSEGQDQIGATIREHALEEALANVLPEARGLKEEKKSVKCESCQAISIFDETRAAQRCDFCGSPSIVPVDSLQDVITPESLLPAVVPATQVRDKLREWYRTRWFAPNKLKKAAMTDTLHGIYLPYWTFDALADSDWTAESGYYYYVSVSDGKGGTTQERRTRWESSSGSVRNFFDDDLVPGTVGVHLKLLRKVEPFPTLDQLKAYEPAYVRGWTVERYQVDLRKASDMSRAQMDERMHQMCERDVPGDTHRSLRVSTAYQGRTFKHILVPVWLATYTYGAKSFQVVVNGFTGNMAGEHPRSWVKIFFAILGVILVVVALLALKG